MLDDRKLAVLRAIVEDYVSTNEPVGSKALVDRHNLGVSSATIRNDMAVLEEQGYIAQPHTSAGRIPTDKGYRLFVDRLSTIKPLSVAERRAIETFLSGAYDLDDVVGRTVRLLAQLTRQVAVVQYPSLTRSSVRHVELVPVAEGRLLLVLITNTGRVEQRVIETGKISEESVGHLRALLNTCLDGLGFGDVPSAVADLPDKVGPDERPVAAAVLSVLLETLVENHEEKIVFAGAAKSESAATPLPDAAIPSRSRPALAGPIPGMSCRTRKPATRSFGFSMKRSTASTSFTWAASRNFSPPNLTKGMLRLVSSTSSAPLWCEARKSTAWFFSAVPVSRLSSTRSAT